MVLNRKMYVNYIAIHSCWIRHKIINCTVTPVQSLNYLAILRILITGDVDYESGPFNITISMGEISVLFNISIIDDDVFEGNRSFYLIIYSPVLLHRFSVQEECSVLMVTIVDDDGELRIKVCSKIMLQ